MESILRNYKGFEILKENGFFFVFHPNQSYKTFNFLDEAINFCDYIYRKEVEDGRYRPFQVFDSGFYSKGLPNFGLVENSKLKSDISSIEEDYDESWLEN